MEHDPQTTRSGAPEGAAAPETTDGVHAPADADGPVAEETGATAPPGGPDGAADDAEAAGPTAGAAQAAGAHARDDAPDPPAGGAPDAESDPAAAEPDYRDQYLRAMAEVDNIRKR